MWLLMCRTADKGASLGACWWVNGWLLGCYIVRFLVGWLLVSSLAGWLFGWLGASTPRGLWCGVVLHGVRDVDCGCACMCSYCKVCGGGFCGINVFVLAAF